MLSCERGFEWRVETIAYLPFPKRSFALASLKRVQASLPSSTFLSYFDFLFFSQAREMTDVPLA